MSMDIFILNLFSDALISDNKSPQERPKSAKRKSPEQPTSGKESKKNES